MKIKNCKKCNKEILIKTSQKFCKECFKIHRREYQSFIQKKYYREKEKKEKHLNICKKWELKNRNKRRMIQKKYSYKNPPIIIAQRISKQIPLSLNCDICSSTKNLQRHHWRYDKPLLINSLCSSCHNIQHIKHFNESCWGRD